MKQRFILPYEQEAVILARMVEQALQEKSNLYLEPVIFSHEAKFSDSGFALLVATAQNAFEHPSERIQSNGINLLGLLLKTESKTLTAPKAEKLEMLANSVVNMTQTSTERITKENICLGVQSMLDKPTAIKIERPLFRNLAYLMTDPDQNVSKLAKRTFIEECSRKGKNLPR